MRDKNTISKIASAVLLTGFLVMSSPAGSVYANTVSEPPMRQERCKDNNSGEKRDRITHLKQKKEKIAKLQKEGKITKEEAEKITAKIDERLKELQKFNALTLNQKKQFLKENVKRKLSDKVKQGKITQSKADEIYIKRAREIDDWDGTGYPFKRSLKPKTDKGKE